ncbi:MAG TPA: orotidine-5'-phosphate decarboxylase [Acidimicrobiales bacterium]|nr:orotidine-5'-phosphate decarboxylase [Acidimicrobiales bacterium]
MAPGAAPPEIRDRLALALDVDDVVAAQRLALELRPWFGVVKIGLELFSAAGPSVVQVMIDDGYRVFLDLKLADIPTTVEKTARVLGALGVSYLTMHAFAGTPMLRAGVEGLADGATRAGLATPSALAVTILTSDADAPPHILGKRVAVAAEARCAGVVCAAGDVREAKALAPSMLAVVPGIRPLGVPTDDQRRSATPAEALAAGADLLVVGRAVTGAPDRRVAAAALVGELAGVAG